MIHVPSLAAIEQAVQLFPTWSNTSIDACYTHLHRGPAAPPPPSSWQLLNAVFGDKTSLRGGSTATLLFSASTGYCFTRKSHSDFLSQPVYMQQPSHWLFCSLPAPSSLFSSIFLSYLCSGSASASSSSKLFLLLSIHHLLLMPLKLCALRMPCLRKAAAFSTSSKPAQPWHG